MKGGLNVIIDAMKASDGPVTVQEMTSKAKSINRAIKKEDVALALKMAIRKGYVKEKDQKYILDKDCSSCQGAMGRKMSRTKKSTQKKARSHSKGRSSKLCKKTGKMASGGRKRSKKVAVKTSGRKGHKKARSAVLRHKKAMGKKAKHVKRSGGGKKCADVPLEADKERADESSSQEVSSFESQDSQDVETAPAANDVASSD